MIIGGAAMKQAIHTIATVFTVPWNVFVAAFLYYTLLAVLALSGLSPSTAVVATAYLAPAVAYGVYVAARMAAASVQGVQTIRLRHAHH
jgi:hypothetical protein